jgi:hypothetical protein
MARRPSGIKMRIASGSKESLTGQKDGKISLK